MPPKLCKTKHRRQHFPAREHPICHIWRAHLHAFRASLGVASWPPKETIKIAPIRCALDVSPTSARMLRPSRSNFSHAVTLHTSNRRRHVPPLQSLPALHTQVSRPSALLGYPDSEHTYWRCVQAISPPRLLSPLIFYIKAELPMSH